MANTYTAGSEITLTVELTDTATGQPTNATGVTISVRDPSGNVTTPAVANPQTGVYTAEITVSTPGVWRWKCVVSSPQVVSSPDQGRFGVEPAAF